MAFYPKSYITVEDLPYFNTLRIEWDRGSGLYPAFQASWGDGPARWVRTELPKLTVFLTLPEPPDSIFMNKVRSRGGFINASTRWASRIHYECEIHLAGFIGPFNEDLLIRSNGNLPEHLKAELSQLAERQLARAIITWDAYSLFRREPTWAEVSIQALIDKDPYVIELEDATPIAPGINDIELD